MVPEGWKINELSELTEKISDGIHSTPKYADDSSIYFINGNNLKNGKIVVNDSTKGVDESDALRHQITLSGRTLLMSINGTIGNLAYYQGEQVVLGKSACYLNVSESVDLDFIYYILSDANTQKFYASELTGTTIRNLSLKTIKSTKIKTPPSAEQKKIAQILSTWDQAINATERLLENSQQRKRGLMQQLLTGKKRLPGFEGEWPSSTLTKHCSVVTGNKDLQNKVENGKYPFFVRSSNVERINSYSFDGEAILIPGDGRVGEIFHYIDGKFDFHQRVYRLSNFKGALGLFVYYYLERFFKAEVIKNSVKATVDSLRMPVFTGMRIKLPSLEEQKSIVDALSCSDREIRVLFQRLDRLKQEKKALMQQLLSGKKRVRVEAA